MGSKVLERISSFRPVDFNRRFASPVSVHNPDTHASWIGQAVEEALADTTDNLYRAAFFGGILPLERRC